MITALKWMLMLSKRLYKKASFIVILAAIPLCVSALVFASSRESGFVKVILAQEDNSDPITNALMDELSSTVSLIDFSEAENPEEAIRAVKMGKADVAWVLLDDMQNRIDKFVQSKNENNAVAKVIVRESNVFSRISQEKLTAAIFKYCAKAQYFHQIRSQIPKLDKIDDATLEEYFDKVTISEDLFTIESVGGATENDTTNYMTAPLRGLLSVAICVCALAASIFYMQDEKYGTFATVNENLRPLVAYACILIAVFNVSLVVLLALLVSNLDAGIMKEAVCLFLYMFSSATFAFFLQQVFGSIQIYAATIPLFSVAMIASCPIFIVVKPLQYLFPPTYFINAFYDSKALIYMGFYTLTLALLSFLILRIKKIRISFNK